MLSKSKNENVPIILNQLNDEVYIRYPYHIYEIDWIHQSLILQAWFIRQNRKQMESQNQQTNNQWTHKNYRCSQTKSKRNPTNPKKNYRSSHSKSNESPKKITEGIKTRSKCKWRERERKFEGYYGNGCLLIPPRRTPPPGDYRSNEKEESER